MIFAETSIESEDDSSDSSSAESSTEKHSVAFGKFCGSVIDASGV